MRNRDALVSIARERNLDLGSCRCSDGRARYAYRVAICVIDLSPVPEGTAGGTKPTFAKSLKRFFTSTGRSFAQEVGCWLHCYAATSNQALHSYPATRFTQIPPASD